MIHKPGIGNLSISNTCLKCNGTQGNAAPYLRFMAQSVPPHQIVIMLRKGTRPLSGVQT